MGCRYTSIRTEVLPRDFHLAPQRIVFALGVTNARLKLRPTLIGRGMRTLGVDFRILHTVRAGQYRVCSSLQRHARSKRTVLYLEQPKQREQVDCQARFFCSQATVSQEQTALKNSTHKSASLSAVARQAAGIGVW